MTSLMYLGKRAVYTAGNSRTMTIPKPVLDELEKGKDFKEIEEVEVYYNREEKALVIKFDI